MATVPNYYYNSPWIQDAGRNLASALAPPDPEKLIAQQTAAFNLQEAKSTAAEHDTDRAGDQIARGALGDLYKLHQNPIFKMDATGAPIVDKEGKRVIDEAAMDQKAFGYADIVTRNARDKTILSQLDPAMMDASPGFRRKQNLAKIVQMAASQRLNMQLSGQMDQIYARGGVQSELDAQKDAAALERVQTQTAGRLAEWKLRGELLAKRLGVTPLTITQPFVNEIASQLQKYEKLTGHQLTDQDRLEKIGEITDLAQTTRNPAVAAGQVWKKYFPKDNIADADTQKIPEPGNLNPFGKGSFINGLLEMLNYDPYVSDTYLKPQEVPAAAPAEAPAAAPAEQISASVSAQGQTPLGAVATQTAPATDPEAGVVASFRDRARAETEKLRNPAPAAAPGAARPPNVPRGGAPTGKSATSPIPVKTPEDVTKLPKGTWFINPQGRVGQSKGPRT